MGNLQFVLIKNLWKINSISWWSADQLIIEYAELVIYKI